MVHVALYFLLWIFWELKSSKNEHNKLLRQDEEIVFKNTYEGRTKLFNSF